ncbi:MAG: hypothetical protein M1833_006125 [Piccolia ochrophora]|nr:MAG: hypothetical protein M1833_006125 [Piccolia ochrophora]
MDAWWVVIGTGSQLLPKNAYDPLEASFAPFSDPKQVGSPFEESGFGFVQIARYTETPIGPYNEITFLPGQFNVSGVRNDFQHPYQRLTRVYVDSPLAAYNLRANWGIPAHLAKFEIFEPDKAKPGAIIKVYPPGATEEKPFFTADFNGPGVPPEPFATNATEPFAKYATGFAQPPLPSAEKLELVATDNWLLTKAVVSTETAYWGMIATVTEPSETDLDTTGAPLLSWWPAVLPLTSVVMKDALLALPLPDIIPASQP